MVALSTLVREQGVDITPGSVCNTFCFETGPTNSILTCHRQSLRSKMDLLVRLYSCVPAALLAFRETLSTSPLLNSGSADSSPKRPWVRTHVHSSLTLLIVFFSGSDCWDYKFQAKWYLSVLIRVCKATVRIWSWTGPMPGKYTYLPLPFLHVTVISVPIFTNHSLWYCTEARSAWGRMSGEWYLVNCYYLL